MHRGAWVLGCIPSVLVHHLYSRWLWVGSAVPYSLKQQNGAGLFQRNLQVMSSERPVILGHFSLGLGQGFGQIHLTLSQSQEDPQYSEVSPFWLLGGGDARDGGLCKWVAKEAEGGGKGTNDSMTLQDTTAETEGLCLPGLSVAVVKSTASTASCLI